MSETDVASQSPSDFEDYDPVEETAEMRSIGQYSVDNLSLVDSQDNSKGHPQSSKSESDFANSTQLTTSRTFSSQLISNYDDLELEYETFSGSPSDLADKPKVEKFEAAPISVTPPVPVSVSVSVTKPIKSTRLASEPHKYIDSYVSTEGDSLPPSKSLESLTCDTTAETEHDSTLDNNAEQSLDQHVIENQEIPQLNVIKNRNKDISVIDLAQIEKYRRSSSHFTATKIASPVIESKLEELNKQFDQLALKIHKIGKEIKFLDDIIPPSTSPTADQSIEYQKLVYARSKLFKKAETLKKEKYELGIKLNNRFKKVYGVNGADKAQYWIRGVSK
ncbi:hypothetical protein CANARDRAFT_26295 [[Candida] arabinofermentans NRRL YB-2248]|uniref:Uncharacterized protein n=1 Tax=[Candida] arabinofermentans NRRL YB-2248 TaxID=983967 RepID=A0A1E4T8P7_9ASCO|nr:hypothetical protein CANARDRAFT_26295 [[Candida] arabinofermentans NRRL YB-2248]